MLYSPHPHDRLLLARERAEALRRDTGRRASSAGPGRRALSFRLGRGPGVAVGQASIALGSGRQS
jgi:hypothetical protein